MPCKKAAQAPISDVRVQVDNNEGRDYTLALVDAPSEDEVLERRARAFEAAESQRLEQINAAEARLQSAADAEADKVAKAAMTDWWDARRIQLREAVKHEVEKQTDPRKRNDCDRSGLQSVSCICDQCGFRIIRRR